MALRVQRVYEPAGAADGVRVLVDRLWPRGLSKRQAQLDHWLREIGPSDELRRWFGHRPERWNEFRRRYALELDGNPALLEQLREIARNADTVTLLFGARDERHNQAVALREYLERSG